jgi:serine/threonine protein kinase
MGEVYRARDTRLGREVAIKVLGHALAADTDARERLRREARALSTLNHPHVCILYDVGEHEGADYLVMELVTGATLSHRIAEGPLAPPEATRLAIQVAEALVAAHRRGVVHRDLKPGNVMITPDGQAKVLDFGLARVGATAMESDVTRTATQHGMVFGTLAYMAPEQLLGRPVDARADQYAFGVMLYEMLTGRSPYRQKLATALVEEIARQPAPPPSEAAPGVSRALDAIALRCMRKDPAERFGDTTELLGALQASIASPDVAPTRSRAPVRAIAAAILVVALAAGTWIAMRFVHLGPASPGAGTIQSLAVLPLENLSGDRSQEYFSDGMTCSRMRMRCWASCRRSTTGAGNRPSASCGARSS